MPSSEVKLGPCPDSDELNAVKAVQSHHRRFLGGLATVGSNGRAMRLARYSVVLSVFFACAPVEPPVTPRSTSAEPIAAAPAAVDPPIQPAAKVATPETASPSVAPLPGKPPS